MFITRQSRQGYRRALAALLPVLLYAASGAASEPREDAGWELEKQEGDISIYTRPVAGSPYLAVRATALIDAPAETVSALLGDGDGCMEWRAMCKSSRVLERVSEDERYVYMVLDLPWPISDRDLVVRSITEYDPGSRNATVNILLDSARHPEQDYVRAETSGQFVIRSIEPGRVAFTYIMHTELGGELSADMVNARLVETTLEDLASLQALAESQAVP